MINCLLLASLFALFALFAAILSSCLPWLLTPQHEKPHGQRGQLRRSGRVAAARLAGPVRPRPARSGADSPGTVGDPPLGPAVRPVLRGPGAAARPVAGRLGRRGGANPVLRLARAALRADP